MLAVTLCSVIIGGDGKCCDWRMFCCIVCCQGGEGMFATERAVRSWAGLQFVVFLHADLVAAG